eukprot:6356659-Prymnesium_polylepis.2
MRTSIESSTGTPRTSVRKRIARSSISSSPFSYARASKERKNSYGPADQGGPIRISGERGAGSGEQGAGSEERGAGGDSERSPSVIIEDDVGQDVAESCGLMLAAVGKLTGTSREAEMSWRVCQVCVKVGGGLQRRRRNFHERFWVRTLFLHRRSESRAFFPSIANSNPWRNAVRKASIAMPSEHSTEPRIMSITHVSGITRSSSQSSKS